MLPLFPQKTAAISLDARPENQVQGPRKPFATLFGTQKGLKVAVRHSRESPLPGVATSRLRALLPARARAGAHVHQERRAIPIARRATVLRGHWLSGSYLLPWSMCARAPIVERVAPKRRETAQDPREAS